MRAEAVEETDPTRTFYYDRYGRYWAPDGLRMSLDPWWLALTLFAAEGEAFVTKR